MVERAGIVIDDHRSVGVGRSKLDGASHVLGHRDSELLWWIKHGITDTPMPTFAANLDERSLCDVVNRVPGIADASAEGSTVRDEQRPCLAS